EAVVIGVARVIEDVHQVQLARPERICFASRNVELGRVDRRELAQLVRSIELRDREAFTVVVGVREARDVVEVTEHAWKDELWVCLECAKGGNGRRVEVEIERHEADRRRAATYEFGNCLFDQAEDQLGTLEARQESRVVERKLSLEKEVRTIAEIPGLRQATTAVETVDVDANSECLFRVRARFLESKKPASPGDAEFDCRD